MIQELLLGIGDSLRTVVANHSTSSKKRGICSQASFPEILFFLLPRYYSILRYDLLYDCLPCVSCTLLLGFRLPFDTSPDSCLVRSRALILLPSAVRRVWAENGRKSGGAA